MNGPPFKGEPVLSSDALYRARVAASPRLSPPRTPWASLAIHIAIVGLWLTLLLRGFFAEGLVGWLVGLVYVVYDSALLAFVFWKTLPLAGRGGPAPLPRAAAGPPATLAVVVAAHNEASVLPATLAAQTSLPDRILIADDGSTDGTASLLARDFGLAAAERGGPLCTSASHPALCWLALPHGGKPAALNAGMERLDTDLVLTVDADTILDPGAIAAMRLAFAADPALVAATGVLAPVCGSSRTARLFQWFQTYEYLRNFLSRYAWMRMDSLLLISGAFAAFRREAVVRVGGFDAACLVEDYELIHRLRRFAVLHRLDWTTAVVGTSRAVTEAPSSLGAFLRQRRRWFGGFLQTQYWYRDMVGNRAYGTLGTLMLPVKAADTWQPIYGLTAVVLLGVYALEGRLDRLDAVAGVIGVKLAFDIAFQLWSIRLYRRWAAPERRIGYLSGLLASLLEPFSFQLLRHLGAALGWVVFLTGAREWGKQHRSALTVQAGEAAATDR